MMIAALYGVIAATTPTGSWRRMLSATRPRTSSSTGTGLRLLVRHRQVEVDRRRGRAPTPLRELRGLGERRRVGRPRRPSCATSARRSASTWSRSACTTRAPLGGGQRRPTAPRRRPGGPRRSPARPRRSGVTETSATMRLVGGVLHRERLVALDPAPGDVRPALGSISSPCSRVSPVGRDVERHSTYHGPELARAVQRVTSGPRLGAVDDGAAEVRRGVAGHADVAPARWRSPARPESCR